jgi:hypothetical protein
MAKGKRLGSLVILLLLTSSVRAMDNESDPHTLATMLGEAAKYCEKLKSTAFKYFCLEHVSETLSDPMGHRRKNVYHYDYQIIGKEGKASEQRTLLFENGNQRHLEKAQLSTRIFSYYSFYMPVFLLAKENQAKYNYQLQAVQKINGREAQGIKVVLRELADGPILDGQVWLDTTDFSVIKIEVNTRYFAGFEQLQKQAMKAGADLNLSDVHWYEVRRNGIRFPSRTEIREIYVMNGLPPGSGRSGASGSLGSIGINGWSGDWNSSSHRWEFDRSRTVFSYSRHRFFNVEMEYSVQPLQD